MNNTSPKTGAIVLGANSLALGIVRSLGAQGIPVWVYDRHRSIAHFSRYTKRSVISHGNEHELLLEDGKKHDLRGWVIFPVEDQYVELLSLHHRSLSSIYQVTTPPIKITRFALDKRLTYRRAAELGIATPWTVTGDTLADLGVQKLPYPLVLKPAVNHHFFPTAQFKALSVDRPADFHAKFAEMKKYIPADEILIQERIPGGGENQFSCAALCREGITLATLTARRTRQYPLDFGTNSTFVETVNQPIVEHDGRRWLESVGFDGIAEVEFKYDPRDGKHKILDVNARAWGWHTLGKAAGIDFTYQLWRQKAGLQVSVGVQRSAAWVRELNDIVAIMESGRRLVEMRRLLNAVRTTAFTSATFDSRDPLPMFAELGLRALAFFRRKKPDITAVQCNDSPCEVNLDISRRRNVDHTV
jgi:predicted ATP-grasp superfamily ATP-dependent carboligase